MHGCGGAAKTTARAECRQQAQRMVVKDGVLLKQPGHALRPTERASLQGKLHKKLDAEAEARAGKKK